MEALKSSKENVVTNTQIIASSDVCTAASLEDMKNSLSHRDDCDSDAVLVINNLKEVSSVSQKFNSLTAFVTRVYPTSVYLPLLSGFVSEIHYAYLKTTEEKRILEWRPLFRRSTHREMHPNIYSKTTDENYILYYEARDQYYAKLKADAEVKLMNQVDRLLKTRGALLVQKMRVLDFETGQTALILLWNNYTNIVESRFYEFRNLSVHRVKNLQTEAELYSSETTSVQQAFFFSTEAPLSDTHRQYTSIDSLLHFRNAQYLHNEIDTIGRVCVVGPYYIGAGQDIHICDSLGNEIKIKFWLDTQYAGFKDVFKFGVLLAFENLRIRHPCLESKKMVFYQDTTRIYDNPLPESHLFIHWKNFRLPMIESEINSRGRKLDTNDTPQIAKRVRSL